MDFSLSLIWLLGLIGPIILIELAYSQLNHSPESIDWMTIYVTFVAMIFAGTFVGLGFQDVLIGLVMVAILCICTFYLAIKHRKGLDIKYWLSTLIISIILIGIIAYIIFQMYFSTNPTL